MSKRTSTEYLVLVVAVRRTETHDSSPSSSAFAEAVPVEDSAPGLAKVEPKPFPFLSLKAGGQ